MTTESTEEWVPCLPSIKCEPEDSAQEDLITEFIPLGSLEAEYLPNSGPLYQSEHNEHDYISTVLIRDAHEEIVSSTCCDETTIMKTKKDNNEKPASSCNSTSSIETVPSFHKSNTQVTANKFKNNSFVSANIIFSDKTLNTIVLAPVSSSANSAVRVGRLSVSPQNTQTKTTVTSSNVDGQSSNIPGLSYALYPSTSVNNTTSVSSALKGSRTSTILCSSMSPVISTQQQALRTITSPSSSSCPVKKIILQKPFKQYSKSTGVSPSTPSSALVEINSPPPVSNVTTSYSSTAISSQSSSTTSSPSRTHSAVISSSSQTIIIYTSPTSNSMTTTLTTSKHLMRTPTVSCASQGSASTLRSSSTIAASAARTIVIGTSPGHLSNSNNISSTVRTTTGNLNVRMTSSQNAGSTRAINISKHVGTNTTPQVSQRSIGINTPPTIAPCSCGTSSSAKEVCTVQGVTGNKPIIPSVSITASSASPKVSGPNCGQSLKPFDASFGSKNVLKRQRDASPPSPRTHTDEYNDSGDNSMFRGGKRECRNHENLTIEVWQKPSSISNADEPSVVSCPSSTNRELQVAIVVGQDADPLSSTEAEFVHSELVKQLKQAMEKSNSPELRFQNSGMVEPGWFMCTCQDSTSLDWLLSLKSIVCPDGRVLKVVRASDLPWPSQVGFHIQGENIDPESVLSLLQGQNKKLKTKKWNILEKKEESNSTFLIYFIDPDSVKALEEYQWTLCYEFTTIPVHLLKGTTESWKLTKESWKVEID